MAHRRKMIAAALAAGFIVLAIVLIPQRNQTTPPAVPSDGPAAKPPETPRMTSATAPAPTTAPHAHNHDGDHDDHDHASAPPVEPETHDAPVSTAPAPTDPTKPLLEPQADGSLLVDRIYRLAGKGTELDPYILRWDMLLSTKDALNPSTGGYDLAPRLKMLEGKFVQLKGYLAVPVITKTADHVLLTWSMMDVCHGVTPKPFQAVEVKLTAPIEVQPHSLAIMTMTGKFRLDPTMKTGWSLVMYMIDDAKLTAVDSPAQ